MNYPMQPQEMGLWCWAAVTESVERYFYPATPLTQCSVASDMWGFSCCPNQNACNRAASLERALRGYSLLNGPPAGRVPFSVIRDQIRQNRPLCVRVGWLGGGGHFLVISGFRVKSGERLVELSDPLYGWSRIPLETFSNRYRDIGAWTHTYFV